MDCIDPRMLGEALVAALSCGKYHLVCLHKMNTTKVPNAMWLCVSKTAMRTLFEQASACVNICRYHFSITQSGCSIG